ncbi:MAG TPA: DNA translocase FtsK [Candidatus Saccharimonadales bacterium]|nr:DNA translocase FtsK [Candidatus Saccharimonadales bacterium]
MAKKVHRAKSRKSFKLKMKPETARSVSQILFFVLAGLVVVSFSRKGLILVKFNDILLQYFAWTSLFLPFIFICFGFLLSKFKRPLGQPNVIIGFLLFFVSISAMSKAGKVGISSWEGVSSLLTGPGAFILFFGITIVGLVILFNTSLDSIFTLIHTALLNLKRYILGENKFATNIDLKGKKELKVLGGSNNDNEKHPEKKKDEIEMKGVTNLPGDAKVWKYPPVSILTETQLGKADRGDIKGNAAIIEQTLESFGVTARVVEVNLGPAVTQYALEVALGTKLAKITALERDLARALASPTGAIRIEAPIPGRNLVGIELPNKAPEFVPMRKMMDSETMQKNSSKLAVALGFDVTGKPLIADIGRMPHVLIAGQTGSGKSVCINTFLASLLFRASPAEVKLILVDPKRVELTGYNNIPHLLTPVIVEPEKVVSALRWILAEMDRRYKLFAEAGVRNIDGYNEMSGFQALPYIVLLIDELADIMLFSPVEVEDSITRIAQMSRATGIHMVLATQRPSVDVITGLIKANIPTRIAFAVSSLVDSRVILDTQGAEKLLGRGDMLYLPPESAKPVRVQGAWVSDKEISTLVSFIKNQGVAVQYTEEVTSMAKGGGKQVPGVPGGETDDLFKQSVELICQYDKASASLLQRRLSIGYARAARILDQLEAAGVVGPADGAKPREVKIKDPAAFFNKES